MSDQVSRGEFETRFGVIRFASAANLPDRARGCENTHSRAEFKKDLPPLTTGTVIAVKRTQFPASDDSLVFDGSQMRGKCRSAVFSGKFS
jgi:hypothetical protein